MNKIAIEEFIKSLPQGQKQELAKVLMDMGFNEVITNAIEEVKKEVKND